VDTDQFSILSQSRCRTKAFSERSQSLKRCISYGYVPEATIAAILRSQKGALFAGTKSGWNCRNRAWQEKCIDFW
jgi:hypothetical protein